MLRKLSKIALVGLLALSVSSPTLVLARGGHGGHGGGHGGARGGSHGSSRGSSKSGSHGSSKGSTSHNGGSKGSKSGSHFGSHNSSHGRSYRSSAVGTPVSSWRSLGSQVDTHSKPSFGASSSSVGSSEQTVKTFYSADTPINALLYRPLYGYHPHSAHILPVQTDDEKQESKPKLNIVILWVLAAVLVPLLTFIGYIAFSN